MIYPLGILLKNIFAVVLGASKFILPLAFISGCDSYLSLRESNQDTGTVSINDDGGRYIYLSPEASNAERQAAKDLSKYLEKSTKVHYSIVPSNRYGDLNEWAILLCKAAEKARWFKAKPTKPHQWLIETNGNEMVITGDIYGTCFGVYEFLEKYLGIMWLAPDTEIVPENLEWKLPKIKEYGNCAFLRREFYTGDPVPFDGYFRMRNKENVYTPFAELNTHHGKPADNHTFELYSADWNENELFATASSGNINKNSLCLTNPKVKKLIIEKLFKYIEADRKGITEEKWPLIYDISQNDGNGLECHCPECKKIWQEEGSFRGLMFDLSMILLLK